MVKKKRRLTFEQISIALNDSLSKVSGLLLLGFFIIHPLAISPETYYNITEFKLSSFTFLVILAIIALVLVYAHFLTKDYIPTLDIKQRIHKIYPHEWALLAYWLWMFISTCFSQYPEEAWTGSADRPEGFWIQSGYLLIFFIVSRFYRPKFRDLLIFSIVGAVVGGYGIFQFYNLDFLGITPAGIVNYHNNLLYVSTMSNRNVISTYLCLIFCVCTVLFAQHSSKLRWAFLPCGLVAFYMLLLGQTESGYLGLLGAFMLCFALLLKDRLSVALISLLMGLCTCLLWLYQYSIAVIYETGTLEQFLQSKLLWAAGALSLLSLMLFLLKLPFAIPLKIWRSVWVGLLVVIVIAGIISLPYIANQTQNDLLLQARDFMQGNISDNMGSYRGYIWRRSVDAWQHNPVLGAGPDCMAPTFMTLYQDEMINTYGVRFDKAHNEYLQILVDTGIVGLLCMLGFFALLLWRALKQITSPMVLAVFIAMLAYIIQAFFNISQSLSTPIVWAMWGMLGALARKDVTGT